VIPDIPQIRDTLAALSVGDVPRAAESERELTICKKRPRILPDGRVEEDPTDIVLKQSQDAPMSLSRIIDRVAEELHKQGHVHTAPRTDSRVSVTAKIVGLSVAIKHLFDNPLQALNLLLDHISEARVIQWAVLVSPSTGADQYRFGDFTYGELDMALFRSRCDRAGSDFYHLYRDRLQGRRSICRDSREIKVLEANDITIPANLDTAAEKLIYRLTNDYYGEVAEGERRVFMIDLDRQQAIFGAGGLGTIPAEPLMQMSAFTQWITVITRQQKLRGWVVPNQTVFRVSTTEPRALAEGYNNITKQLKLHDWQRRPLDPWIQNYCHYITAAQDYHRNGRIEEALLHLVFGLDLLLGGEAGDALTTVLAERVAFLSHCSLVRSLKEVSDFMRDCYDLRSGYVHRGGKGTLGETKGSLALEARLDLLSQVARAVLGAACFARLQAWSQLEEARYAWIKRIDVLRAKRDAGLGVDEADLAGLGVAQVRLHEGELPAVTIEWAS
jgi:hypothetical protein